LFLKIKKNCKSARIKMKKLKTIITVILISIATQAQQQNEILLWPAGAPGSEGKTGAENIRIAETGDHVVKNIHKPSITAFVPAKNKSTGIAVIVAPGGGHRELWIDHEGYNVAEYLKSKGIAAFVLKYRLARDSNSTYTIDKEELADMQRAIRLIKSRATEWNIDTAKLGVMGFSAGGEVAALSAMKFDNSNINATDSIDKINARPAFQGLIYPGNSSRYEPVKNAPPLFILGGYGDRADIAEGIANVYLKYKKANIPAELHIYSKAGHGFGIRKTNKGPVSLWLQRFVEWVTDTAK
jgi:acetyl esterase/lipase